MSRQLADQLALAILDHGPASGSRLARRVHARKGDVLAELRASPRFQQLGRGRGTRWRLCLETPSLDAWEPKGTGSEPERGQGAGARDPDRLEALERRMAEVERQLAAPDPAENGIPGQVTVFEILAETEAPAA